MATRGPAAGRRVSRQPTFPTPSRRLIIGIAAAVLAAMAVAAIVSVFVVFATQGENSPSVSTAPERVQETPAAVNVPVEQATQIQEPVAAVVEPTPTIPEPATPTLVTIPEFPVAEPVTEPQVEVPSAEPVPGSCLILEEKFCDNGTVVRIFGEPMLAFRLPPGTLLFAPWSGKVFLGGTSAINPKLAGLDMLLDANSNQVADPEDIGFAAHGDFEILPGAIEQGVAWEQSGLILIGDHFTVAQGAPIARMRDTGATTLRGNHNLVVFVVSYDSARGAFAISQQLTQELLPAISSN